MINAVKLVILLLLTWMLFMRCNCSITFVAAPEPTQIWPVPAAATAEAPTAAANEDFTTPDSATAATTPTNGVDYQRNTSNASESSSSNDDDPKSPREVQKAVCTVTAGEVRASAEAVTTKTLKGVCGSAELKLAFSDLEAKMYQELQEIKVLLHALAQKADISVPVSKSPHFSQPLPTVATISTTPANVVFPNHLTVPKARLQPIAERPAFTEQENEISHFEPKTSKSVKTPQLKSLGENTDSTVKKAMREDEISKFNNTMLTDRDFKVFTYYWKLENFSTHIESGDSKVVESPIFSIKGKSLQLSAHFQHLHRDFLYLQLEYATLKNSNRNNIMLDMGGLFKEINNEKVVFKHKISLLNQHQERFKDLVSPEFYNLDKGFLIPNSALLDSPYIKQDSLLIQIFLYL